MLRRAILRTTTCIKPLRLPPRPARHGYFQRTAAAAPVSMRQYSSGKSDVDSTIEDLQDMYATAKDEFEMAMEETEGNTVYAPDDREAAREEFDKFKKAYETSLKGPSGAEIESRIGTRVRELENAVKNMEELAQNQD